MATTMSRAHFLAYYEDAAKVNAAHEGCADPDGHDPDVAQSARCRAWKRCGSLDEAVAWIKAAVESNKTFYGCGTVHEIEKLTRDDRCKACVCGGERALREYYVSDEGIDDETAITSPCLED